MAFLKNDKLIMVEGASQILQWPLVLKISLGIFFDSRNSKTTSWYLAIGKILSIMHGKYAVYICEKKICVTIAELIIF